MYCISSSLLSWATRAHGKWTVFTKTKGRGPGCCSISGPHIIWNWGVLVLAPWQRRRQRRPNADHHFPLNNIDTSDPKFIKPDLAEKNGLCRLGAILSRRVNQFWPELASRTRLLPICSTGVVLSKTFYKGQRIHRFLPWNLEVHFLPFFVFLALLLKNQSSITPLEAYLWTVDSS